MNKKNFKIFFLFFILLIVQGCNEQNKNDGTSNTSLPAQASKQISEQTKICDKPEYGGQLVLASIGEPSNLIPILSADSASHEVANFIFTSLIKYDKDYNIVPLAAEYFEILENGCLFRFKLRENIYWQDGVQLTADDVHFTYKLTIDPKTPTPYAADCLLVKEFTQTGKFSFEVRYEKPYARAIITWMMSILPKHLLENEDITNTPFSRNPIGAGPFRLTEWKTGSRLVLEAYDKYFEGRPYLDKFIYRIIPDVTTIFLEAKANAIDYMGLTAQQYLLQTKEKMWQEKWQKYKYTANVYTYIGFNLKHPFFEDKLVRQALSYASNRDTIIKGALLGLGEKIVGPYKPNTWANNNNLEPYPHDPEKALELFAKAGWTRDDDGWLQKDGKRFSFTILLNQGNKERENTLLILQEDWKKLGIEIKIRTVEWATFINEFVLKGQYDAVILAWTILEDPDVYDVWHSSAIRQNGLNFVHFRNEEVDMLLEKARSTTDRKERKQYYDRFQEILHEEQPYLFLYVPYSLPMVQKRFCGVEPAISGISHNMEKWWIPELYQ